MKLLRSIIPHIVQTVDSHGQPRDSLASLAGVRSVFIYTEKS